MKAIKLLIIAVAMSVSASAHAFFVQGNATVNTNSVAAAVYNGSAGYMACNIKAVGQLNNGQILFSWANNVVIAPGTYGYANVWVNYPGLYFVAGDAQAWCQWM